MVVLCSFALGVVPFAFTDTVNGAIIAGIFSVVNTILNLRLMRVARGTQEAVAGVQTTAQEAKQDMHEHLQKANGENDGPS